MSPYLTDAAPQAKCSIPAFGSAEHMDWIRRRLSKNIRFREEVETAALLALRAHKEQLLEGRAS